MHAISQAARVTARAVTCTSKVKRNSCWLIFWDVLRGVAKASRCVAAAAPAFAAMEDLPAVEPVKIYENTYRLEPADTERCAASGGANAPGTF